MTTKRKVWTFVFAVIGALIVLRVGGSLLSLMAPNEEARRVSVSSLLRSYDYRNRSAVVQLQNAHADQDTIAYVKAKTEEASTLGDEIKRDLGFANPGNTTRIKFRQYVQIQCEIERRAVQAMTSSQPWTRAGYSRETYNKNVSRDMQFGCS